uniref:histidine kinase n=1 Tax=Gracilinema caldarium TaxID=215591 RepID=A0A7C3EH89_9SPIR
MFEELHILSVERQLYAELYGCATPAEIFSCLERSVKQLIPYDGLYIRYENQLQEKHEKLYGPQAEAVKAASICVSKGKSPGQYWFQFPFGEGHGAQGILCFTIGKEPSPSTLCSVERMLHFCSRSLYQYELLQKVEQYAKEQELLLRELRHRTHNNLQFMLGTLPFLLHDSEGLPHHIKEKLEQRFQGLIVLSSIWDSQSIDNTVSAPSYFVSVVRTLRKLWLEGRGSLELSLQIDESLVLSKEMATTIALILNELVTNTLKHSSHAFPLIKLDIQQTGAGLLFWYHEAVDAGGSKRETVQEKPPAYLPNTLAGGQGRNIIQGLVARVGGAVVSEAAVGETETYQFTAVFPLKQD